MKKVYKKPSTDLLLLYTRNMLAGSDTIDIDDDDELDPSAGESRKKDWNSKLWAN